MGLLIYLGRPILFILVCMIVVRLIGSKKPRPGRMIEGLTKWLWIWSLIGFATAAFLGVSAWIMNNDFIMSHADWVWPFCIGLMALQGEPTALDILVVLGITAIGNAMLYFGLAAIVGVTFHLLARVRGPRNRSLSIFGP
jgi:hypothetical protein